MTEEIPETSERSIRQAVGNNMDMGINFIAVSYDSQRKSLFFNG